MDQMRFHNAGGAMIQDPYQYMHMGLGTNHFGNNSFVGQGAGGYNNFIQPANPFNQLGIQYSNPMSPNVSNYSPMRQQPQTGYAPSQFGVKVPVPQQNFPNPPRMIQNGVGYQGQNQQRINPQVVNGYNTPQMNQSNISAGNNGYNSPGSNYQSNNPGYQQNNQSSFASGNYQSQNYNSPMYQSVLPSPNKSGFQQQQGNANYAGYSQLYQQSPPNQQQQTSNPSRVYPSNGQNYYGQNQNGSRL